MIKLNLYSPEGELKKEISLHAGVHRIGSNEENSVVLKDESVDSVHAELVVGKTRCSVRDLESHSGVKVNGNKIGNKEIFLEKGDLVEVGGTKFEAILEDYARLKKTEKIGCLRLLSGKADDIPLAEGENIMGKISQCDVQVPDPLCSRKHAKIVRKDNVYYIKDLESTNGTYLNQRRIKEEPLKENDVIQIGQCRYRFFYCDRSDVAELIASKEGEKTAQMATTSPAALPENVDFSLQRSQRFLGVVLIALVILIVAVPASYFWTASQLAGLSNKLEHTTDQQELSKEIQKEQEKLLELRRKILQEQEDLTQLSKQTQQKNQKLENLEAKIHSAKKSLKGLIGKYQQGKKKLAQLFKKLRKIQKQVKEQSDSASPPKSAPSEEKEESAKQKEQASDKQPETQEQQPKEEFALTAQEQEILAQIQAEKPISPDLTKVVGAEKCSTCHRQPYQRWQQTPHFATYENLREEGKSILDNMEISGSIRRGGICMNCHFTVEESSSGRQKAISGVSCESCHGPAQEWITVHNAPASTPEQKKERRAKAAKVGMVPPGNIYAMASNCYECHTVLNEKLVNVGKHQAGSDFELVAWSQGIVRHNFLFSQANKKTPIEKLRVMYIVGAITDMEYKIRGLAQAQDPNGKYAQQMQTKFQQARQRVEQIYDKVALEPLKRVLLLTKNFSASAEKATAKMADKIAVFAKKVSTQHDGSQLAAIDSLLPAESSYKGGSD